MSIYSDKVKLWSNLEIKGLCESELKICISNRIEVEKECKWSFGYDDGFPVVDLNIFSKDTIARLINFAYILTESGYNKHKDEFIRNNYNKCKDDNINPKHYKLNIKGVDFQVIDIIDCVCAELPGHIGYCLGNALKYLIRYRNKNGLEDVKKAQWYVERLIGYLK